MLQASCDDWIQAMTDLVSFTGGTSLFLCLLIFPPHRAMLGLGLRGSLGGREALKRLLSMLLLLTRMEISFWLFLWVWLQICIVAETQYGVLIVVMYFHCPCSCRTPTPTLCSPQYALQCALQCQFSKTELIADPHQGVSKMGVNSSSLTQFIGTLCLTANNTGLATIVFWVFALLLFASWWQCIEKSTSIIWELRGSFRNTQLWNIIEGLKIN